MATPLIYDIRQKYPDAKLTVMGPHPIVDLLNEDPNVNEVFGFTRVRNAIRRMNNRSIHGALAGGKHDVGVLVPNSLSSAWSFYQGQVKRRIGFSKDMRGLLLTDAVKRPKRGQDIHQVEVYKRLLAPLDIRLSKTAPKLYVKDAEIQAAWDLLKKFGVHQGEPLIGINPGAAFGSAKCWMPERFHEVVKELSGEYRVLVFGDRKMSPLNAEICRGLNANVINLAGSTSIRELMALISLCRVLLTNDSGPMHMADALGTKIVALFGSTSPIATGPYQGHQIIQHKVECSPCFERKCPIDFRCMKGIQTGQVLVALRRALHVD
ncbi:MAG: ADP-heptose--LPS heptosyltransferase 2 [Chlamydiia bacterium]|nr:ADP-heptose--LPS heptosyltransferase 2 [Chlamydiia bacterium]MCH9616249.1 ADP-heptose--LPS heptosyltransferase 2 [Chlamydiia bacterium]MCH9629765.1 ADP-heptose--LPS heptosyltransferase 2 [Chlamydiia bacterium]